MTKSAKQKKAKVTPKTKFRCAFHGGPADGRIDEVEAEELPINIFVPFPPPDFSTVEEECYWKTGIYVRNNEPDDGDINGHFDFGGKIE